MKRRLSGWTRLWVVAALSIWSAGIIHVTLEEQPVPLPPIVMSTHDICYEFYPSAENFRGGWADNTASHCIENADLQSRSRAWHWDMFGSVWGFYWPWWVAPFALGLAMLGVGWIRRGFSNPTAN